MNKNGNIKGKFNIIDILVVILIIAVIAGIAVRYKSRITTAVKSDEAFSYVVKVPSVRGFTIDALKETMKTESKLSDKKGTVDLGKIVNVDVKPATVTVTKADGTIVDTPQEDRYIAYVTIETRGKESDNSYITADSNELSVGRYTELISKYVHTSGQIMEVNKK